MDVVLLEKCKLFCSYEYIHMNVVFGKIAYCFVHTNMAILM
jgi:hypothetical protein